MVPRAFQDGYIHTHYVYRWLGLHSEARQSIIEDRITVLAGWQRSVLIITRRTTPANGVWIVVVNVYAVLRRQRNHYILHVDK